MPAQAVLTAESAKEAKPIVVPAVMRTSATAPLAHRQQELRAAKAARKTQKTRPANSPKLVRTSITVREIESLPQPTLLLFVEAYQFRSPGVWVVSQRSSEVILDGATAVNHASAGADIHVFRLTIFSGSGVVGNGAVPNAI
jgi:hypothetical protein